MSSKTTKVWYCDDSGIQDGIAGRAMYFAGFPIVGYKPIKVRNCRLLKGHEEYEKNSVVFVDICRKLFVYSGPDREALIKAKNRILKHESLHACLETLVSVLPEGNVRLNAVLEILGYVARSYAIDLSSFNKVEDGFESKIPLWQVAANRMCHIRNNYARSNHTILALFSPHLVDLVSQECEETEAISA